MVVQFPLKQLREPEMEEVERERSVDWNGKDCFIVTSPLRRTQPGVDAVPISSWDKALDKEKAITAR